MTLFRLLILPIHLDWLQVNAHVGFLTKTSLQAMLDIRGMLMGFIERSGTGHANMHLDGYLVADATSLEIMHLTNTILFIGEPNNLIFLRLRQTGIRQLLD